MRNRAILIAIGAALLSAILVAPAQAAVTVSNANDSGPGSLRNAVESASPNETINLPAGTYNLGSPLVIETPLTIAGHASADTVIRTVANTQAIQIMTPGSLTLTDASFRDMTIAKPSGVIQAGLISNTSESTLTLQRVVFSGITIDASGAAGGSGGVVQGGLVLDLGSSAFLDVSFVRNRILANGGAEKNGGVIQAGLMNTSGGTFRNVAIDENTFETKGGAGASNPGQNGGVIQGGAILLIQNKAEGTVLDGVSLSANVADASGGPGANGGVIQAGALLAAVSKGSLVARNTTIAANVARALGSPPGTAQGAGALVSATATGTATFESSTIYANRAEAPGPGAGAGNLGLTGPVSFKSSIVAAGAGASGKENCQTDGKSLSGGFNIESTDQCGLHGINDKVNTDPQLGPLQSNGGPGLSLVPAVTSPAVDQGSTVLTTDQRGVLRPIDFPTIANASGGNGADIGAVELQPSNAVALGKLKKNKRKGQAVLTVTLPAPSAGTLVLEGKGLKTQTKAIAGETTLNLKVIPTGKTKKALRKKGKRKVGLTITYTPTGNVAAAVTRKIKLVKKNHKPKKHRKTPKK